MTALSDRISRIGDSPTLAISAEAKRLRAAGVDVIGFGAGEPDFATPAHIVAAAEQACADPAMHKYTPVPGQPVLREAIAAKTARDSGLQVDPSQVTVTNGGKHALFNVFQALIDPGDEVLVPAPYWVSYPEQVALAGGTVVPLPTTAEAGYRVSVEQLEAARTPATKALVFVSPSNPTGTVYPPDELRRIGRWAAGVGIWVITDEIYEHLVYGDATFASLPVEVPELADRCVVANGVAKTYAMTGWRVGWSIAPPVVAAGIGRLQSHVTSNVCNVAQRAALAAVSGPLDEVVAMRDTFDRRRRRAHEALSAIPDVTCPLPGGAFYLFPDVRARLERPVAGRRVASTVELCALLLDEARVALVLQ
jgi:aspartate aminotransferase